MQLTDRELANVLMSLRVMQESIQWGGDYSEHPSLDGHEIMDPDEFDALCEKINPPQTLPAPPESIDIPLSKVEPHDTTGFPVPTVGTGEMVVIAGSAPVTWVTRTVNWLMEREDLREETGRDALGYPRVRILPLDEDEPVFSAQMHDSSRDRWHVAAVEGLIPEHRLPKDSDDAPTS